MDVRQAQEVVAIRQIERRGQQRFEEMKGAIAPWTNVGLEPPNGVNVMWDQYKAKANAQQLEALNDLLAKAQDSLTKERSPDQFKACLDQVAGVTCWHASLSHRSD